MALTSQAWKAEARGQQICNFLKPVVMSVAGKEPMEQSILSRDRSTIEDWSEGQTGRKNGFCQNLNVHYLRAASQLTGWAEDGDRAAHGDCGTLSRQLAGCEACALSLHALLHLQNTEAEGSGMSS